MSQIHKEGRRRLDVIRDQMRPRNLDALLIYSQRRGHVSYVSGYHPNYHTNSAVIVLPAQGEPVLMVKFGFDLARARSVSWIEDIRPSQRESQDGIVQTCHEALREKDLEKARIGLVASDEAIDEMSFSLFKAIRERLPRAQIEPASDLVNSMRLRKSSAEIAQIRRATEIAEAAAETLQHFILPGNEDYLAVAQAAMTAHALGAERCDAIISVKPADLAYPPGHRRFVQGNPVSCELTVQYEGYWAQICRTFSLGEPSPQQRHIFLTACNAYEKAVETCCHGTSVAKIANVAVEEVDRAGYSGCIKYGLGHGVGLDLPEPYSVELHSNETLASGTALVIHIGIWAEGQGAAFVGGPIVIDTEGATVLDHPHREMAVL
jgi:Xaa-Pro dipeptidase